jgi:hypothetical protein
VDISAGFKRASLKRMRGVSAMETSLALVMQFRRVQLGSRSYRTPSCPRSNIVQELGITREQLLLSILTIGFDLWAFSTTAQTAAAGLVVPAIKLIYLDPGHGTHSHHTALTS